eukprot:CCRYP_011400-RA/>CCRYP_011400-RA protein AED:0.48 eAED:0.48 QI:0/0/0/1/1/1/2/0/290
MDMEFEPLIPLMDQVAINTTAAREHVGDVECAIQAIKERARCIMSYLLYNDSVPDQILIHLLQFVVLWINAMSSDSEIVTGTKLDFKKHCRARFGAYVEASYDDENTNTLKDRTHSCITVGPTGNIQGLLKCFDLKTGHVVKRRTFTVLPIPNQIICKVKQWGKKSKQRRSKEKLDFLNRHKQQFAWDIAPDKYKGRVWEVVCTETDEHPAKLPDITLESDYEDAAVVASPGISQNKVMTAVMANANLTPLDELHKLTGVDNGPSDSDAYVVLDDEGEDDEAMDDNGDVL